MDDILMYSQADIILALDFTRKFSPRLPMSKKILTLLQAVTKLPDLSVYKRC